LHQRIFGFVTRRLNEIFGGISSQREIDKRHKFYFYNNSKSQQPQRLNDFRPISLVGCLYKVLAKVLTNRLRLVVGYVVSESQSAFVPGKQILYDILIANEAVDEARRLSKELLMFKVDFKKAYDSVDLKYLDLVMENMNFPRL